MNWLLIGGIALALLALLLIRGGSSGRGKPQRTGYQKRDFLLSSEERLFYSALRQAVGEEYEVFGHIRAGDVIIPRAAASRNSAQEDYEVIEDLSFAFVLCAKADLSVACAIQLLEHALPGKKSQTPDPLKAPCHAAGLPLVLFEVGPLYNAQEIREAIAQAVRKEPLYLTESDGRKEPRISSLENLEL